MRASITSRQRYSGVFALVILCISVMLCACSSVSSFAFAEDSEGSEGSYATWTSVSQAIDNELSKGKSEYKDGNISGASTRFQAAYNSVYVGSNFITVVRDTIGQDKVQSHNNARVLHKNQLHSSGPSIDEDCIKT